MHINSNITPQSFRILYFFRPLLVFGLILSSFSGVLHAKQPGRIITLSSALTETVYALGLGGSIVATDVTSVSPIQAKSIPKVSRNRSASAEGIASYRPDLVLAPDGDLSRETILHLKSIGVRVVVIRQEYSANGSLSFIRQVAAAIDLKNKGEQLAQTTRSGIEAAIAKVKAAKIKTPKVLFIYARGTGTMSVAGKGSNMDAIIQLAGGKNAIQEFSDFKPYTTEALVKANPDIILMFDFGLSSLGGKQEMLSMPGVRLTNAGKSKRIITMEGALLVNFSVRLPEAITELNSLIRQ